MCLAKKTINATDVAVLGGRPGAKNFANNMLNNDHNFPRPVIVQKGVTGSLWFEHEVVAYFSKPKEKKAETRPKLDLALSLKFITGKREVFHEQF